MHRSPDSFAAELLLEDTPWLQRLAYQLVRDPNVAEDLAQETLLAALESRGGAPRSRRAWLGAVLRRLLWERLRSEDRRTAREERAAGGDETVSTAELYERMALRQQVVDAVSELPDHYRETILRRYFENESPSVIARSTGVPISTVKTRLARAQSILRDRLDEEYGGDGRAWALALAPLIHSPKPAGSAISSAGFFAAVAAVVVSGLALFSWFVKHEERAGLAPPAREELLVSDDRAEALEVRPNSANPGERTALGASGEAHPRELGPAPGWSSSQPPVLGGLRDVSGRPLSGFVLRFEPSNDRGVKRESIALSDSDGSFEFQDVDRTGLIRAWAMGWVTLYSAIVRSDVEREGAVVVAALAARLDGLVVDARGVPVENARVQLNLPIGMRESFPRSLENSLEERFATLTAADGSFSFEQAPSLEGLELQVDREGLESARVRWSARPPASVRVELSGPMDLPDSLEGRVVDELGDPIAQARVSDGTRVVRTDSLGRFWFDSGAAGEWIALATGYGPVKHRVDGATQEGLGDREPIVMRLPSQGATIAGRVVDSRGNPLGGMRVWLNDPTPFAIPSGERLGSSLWRPLPGMEPQRDVPESVEALLGDSPTPTWPAQVTDSQGNFEITGLFRRPYTLKVLDPETLLTAEAKAVDANPFGKASNALVEVVLDTSALVASVEGRVVDETGQACPGLRMTLVCPAYSLRRGSEELFTNLFERGGVRTNTDGRFRWADVPPRGVALRVEGPGTLPFEYGVDLGTWPSAGPLELQIERARELRIGLDPEDPAQEAGLVDDDGNELEMYWRTGIERTKGDRAPLRGGRSPLLLASVRSAEIVLYADGKELRRIAVDAATVD